MRGIKFSDQPAPIKELDVFNMLVQAGSAEPHHSEKYPELLRRREILPGSI